MARRSAGFVFAVWLAAGAGACGGSADECAGGCPAGQMCYVGICVPAADGGETGDGAADADARDTLDRGPDADADDGGVDVRDGPDADDARTDARDDGAVDDAAVDEASEDVVCDPTAPELCNGRDDNCDGICDNGFGCCRGSVVSCLTTCHTSGTRTCGDACTFPAACAPPPETCNGVDDDCNGVCDDGFACCAGLPTPCTTLCGSTGTSTCTASCTVGETCTPPTEICNGRDDDCDGLTDEGCTGNDTCASPTTIAPGPAASGSTVGLADNAHGSCGGTGAPDAFYSFRLSGASDVFLHTVPSSYDSVIYASATCGSADLGCNDDIYTSYVTASGLELHGLAAGTYYVAVDGYSTTSAGDYTLTMYSSPAGTAGDQCGYPLLIPRPSSGGTGSVSGDTCAMTDQATGSCGGSVGGGDAVYYFVVHTRGTVTFSTCNAATTSGTILYVRSACTTAASELGCNAGGSSSACATNPSAAVLAVTLDPGLYFLFVDSASILPLPGMCGAFRVDVTGL